MGHGSWGHLLCHLDDVIVSALWYFKEITKEKYIQHFICFPLEINPNDLVSLLEADVSYMFSSCPWLFFWTFAQRCVNISFLPIQNLIFKTILSQNFLQQNGNLLCLYWFIQRYTGKGHAYSPCNLIHLAGSDPGRG